MADPITNRGCARALSDAPAQLIRENQIAAGLGFLTACAEIGFFVYGMSEKYPDAGYGALTGYICCGFFLLAVNVLGLAKIAEQLPKAAAAIQKCYTNCQKPPAESLESPLYQSI